MHVLICPDRMGPLSSRQAGAALATGWPGSFVLPVGEAGAGFVESSADAWSTELWSGMLDGALVTAAYAGDEVALAVSGAEDPARPDRIPYDASSDALGRAVAAVLAERQPRRLLLDLAGLDVHDAGAGLLGTLGARATGAALTGGVAGLTGLATLDLEPARGLLGGVELIGVVPTSQRHDPLLGLRGITSRRGRAAGADPATLLATDAALQRFTDLAAPGPATAPGAGACGGLGWAVLALGGRLCTGPEVGLAAADESYHLVVTGCGVFDFATRGGGVVAAAAELAASRLAPCVVIAGEVLIGGREMRTMGIEAAYAIRESRLDKPTGADLSSGELERAAVRVGRSWRW